MTSALFSSISSARSASALLLRCGRACSSAAAANSKSSGPAATATAANAAAGDDSAAVTLRGTVERLMTAGPGHCIFLMATSFARPGADRAATFRHTVKAFGERAEAANAVAKVGSRVHVEGCLTYERRFRLKPAGDDNPYRCVIDLQSVRALGYADNK